MINKPILGDCLLAMDQIADHTVDMILSDLPYGTTSCKWDIVIPFNLLWEQFCRIVKEDGAIVITSAQPFTSFLVMSNISWFKYEWIYQKTSPTGFLNAKKQPLRYHENVCVFYKKQPTYNPIKTINHTRKTSLVRHKKNTAIQQDSVYRDHSNYQDYSSTERYPKSVQLFASDKQKDRYHPTQKPLALFEYLIKTYTNEGNLVLDCCAGSFTTAVACDNLNRKWICIEKDEKYFNIGVQRVNTNRLKLQLPGVL